MYSLGVFRFCCCSRFTILVGLHLITFSIYYIGFLFSWFFTLIVALTDFVGAERSNKWGSKQKQINHQTKQFDKLVLGTTFCSSPPN